MDEDKLKEHLLFFAKFDYALCRAGFAKEGRKIGENIKTWEACWETFHKNLPNDFFDKIKDGGSYSEIFKDGGPKTYGKKGDDPPQFHPEEDIEDNKTLIYACKHIRNNLIHGEKLQLDQDDVKRNQNLLSEAKGILEEAMSKVENQNMKEFFDDILIS